MFADIDIGWAILLSIGIVIIAIAGFYIIRWLFSLIFGRRHDQDSLFHHRFKDDGRNGEKNEVVKQRLYQTPQTKRPAGSAGGYPPARDPYDGDSSDRPAGSAGVYSTANYRDNDVSSARPAASPAGGGPRRTAGDPWGRQTAGLTASSTRRDEPGARKRRVGQANLYQWVEYLIDNAEELKAQLGGLNSKLSLAPDEQEISRQIAAMKGEQDSRWSTLQEQWNTQIARIDILVGGMDKNLAGLSHRQQKIEHQLAEKEPALAVLAGMVEENEHIKKAMQDLIHFRRADDYTLAPEAMQTLEQVRERLTATTQQLGELAKQVKQEQGLPTVLEKFSELGSEIKGFLDGLQRKELWYETRIPLDPSHRDVGYEMSLGLTKAHDRLTNPGAAFQRQYEDLLRSYLVPLLVNLEDRRKTQMQLDLVLNALMREAQISPYEPVGSEFNGEKMIPDSIDDAKPKNIVCGVKTRGFYYRDKLLLPPRVIIGGRSMG